MSYRRYTDVSDWMQHIVDPEDGHSHDKTLKIRSQQERQTRTMQLSREGKLGESCMKAGSGTLKG